MEDHNENESYTWCFLFIFNLVYFFLQTSSITLQGFLNALSWTVDKQFEDRENLKNDH